MRRRRSRRRSPKFAMLAIPLIIIVLVFMYQGGRWLETRDQKPKPRGDHQQRYALAESTVEVKKAVYRRREGVTSILLVGVDRNEVDMTTDYRNTGQADFIMLMVSDKKQKKVTWLQIDRDAMAPITILGVMGDQSGTRIAQVCLAHGFGDGKQQSCELTVDAVSKLLLNAPIDDYMAISMDGISTLNDIVGGVTVTLEDDFSLIDPEMTQGSTLTLNGSQAEIFVRGRQIDGQSTNEARMKRQLSYIKRLMNQMEGQIASSPSFVNTLSDAMKPYMVTSLSQGELINRIAAIYGCEWVFTKLDGTHQIGSDGFMQFYADEESIRQQIIDMFYQKVE